MILEFEILYKYGTELPVQPLEFNVILLKLLFNLVMLDALVAILSANVLIARASAILPSVETVSSFETIPLTSFQTTADLNAKDPNAFAKVCAEVTVLGKFPFELLEMLTSSPVFLRFSILWLPDESYLIN